MSAQDGTCSEGNGQLGYPSLCKNGCGFFSSVDAKGFCSVCYKDFLKKENADAERRTQNADATKEVADAAASLSNLNVSVEQEDVKKETECEESQTEGGAVAKSVLEAAPEVVEEKVEAEDKEGKKPKKNRCASCKKKIGLTGFTCRCGGMYCGIHRYSDKHNCDFDYNAMGKAQIAAANPVIVAEKVSKI